MIVKERLTSKRPRRGREHVGRSPVENDAYGEMMARLIRRLGQRVGEGDVEDLGRMLELHRLMEESMQVAVDGLRRHGKSWAFIGRGAGMTRQAAQQRWGRT